MLYLDKFLESAKVNHLTIVIGPRDFIVPDECFVSIGNAKLIRTALEAGDIVQGRQPDGTFRSMQQLRTMNAIL